MTTQVTLKNGDKLKINDHVYCSPSWSTRDGTPYSVARVMEFLPPVGVPRTAPPPPSSTQISTSASTSSRKEKEKEKDATVPHTRVRLAWYYRPADVSDRAVADNRILLAAIYSEVCEIGQLRSKCYVVHRDKISDLAGWKKRPDRFYFQRLFDPYIKKEFEIIPSTAVRNVPDNVRENLIERYEYLVAEKDTVPDLIDSIRLCESCSKWCPNSEAVQCDRCKKWYHMACVTPPLSAKPSRGYGWKCAPCSQAAPDQTEVRDGAAGGGPRHSTPTAKPARPTIPAARGRGRPRKDRSQMEKEENMEIKHYKMWPFRYFGQYTVAEDTLDEDDFIFPHYATRLGPKYQVASLPIPGPVDPVPGPDEHSGPEAVRAERGEDATIEVLGAVSKMESEQIAEFEAYKKKLAATKELLAQVDYLTEVTRRLSEAFLAGKPMSSVEMPAARAQKWKKGETRWVDKEWGEDEKVAFEDGIQMHGAELRAVRQEIGTRTHAEVVRYYGHWKASKLRDEFNMTRDGTALKKEDKAGMLSDDEESLVKVPTRGTLSCAACRTRETTRWWKAPKGLSTSVLCDNCGLGWRKYADLNVRSSREETSLSTKGKVVGDKRDGTPLSAPPAKRTRTSASASVSSTPPPLNPNIPQLRCTACKRSGSIGKVLKCTECHFQVHAGCCGAVVEPDKVDAWLCDLCQNSKDQEACLNTDCVLCPRIKRDRKEEFYPPPDSFLRACKPTEGQNWAHVLCTVFAPETSFADPARLRLVEGISAIPRGRWAAECSICRVPGGSVVRCSDCAREYHVSCAWKTGYRVGFEILPVKPRQRDTTIVVTFNGEEGLMVPVVRCLHHTADKSSRTLFDICDTDDGSGETALQMYCVNYKSTNLDRSYGILRKARRLDDILAEFVAQVNGTDKHGYNDSGAPTCATCHTAFSPFFHPLPLRGSSSVQEYLCHRCHMPAPPALADGTESGGGTPFASGVNGGGERGSPVTTPIY